MAVSISDEISYHQIPWTLEYAICSLDHYITLKFDRFLCSSAAEALVKPHSFETLRDDIHTPKNDLLDTETDPATLKTMVGEALFWTHTELRFVTFWQCVKIFLFRSSIRNSCCVDTFLCILCNGVFVSWETCVWFNSYIDIFVSYTQVTKCK